MFGSYLFLSIIALSFVGTQQWHKNPYNWKKCENEERTRSDTEATREIEDLNKINTTNPEDAFKEYVKYVIDVDKKSLKFCHQFTRNATEIYSNNNYKLKILLKDFDPENIEIKIVHRVMFIKGLMPVIDPRWQADGMEVNDIRKLPMFLNVKKAIWSFKNHILTLTIPYKVSRNREVAKICDLDFDVDEKEILVPEEKEEIGIDQDLLDEIFGPRVVAAPMRLDDPITTTTAKI